MESLPSVRRHINPERIGPTVHATALDRERRRPPIGGTGTPICERPGLKVPVGQAIRTERRQRAYRRHLAALSGRREGVIRHRFCQAYVALVPVRQVVLKAGIAGEGRRIAVPVAYFPSI